MKVALDEHVPPAMAKILVELARTDKRFRTRGTVFESAADYAPKPKDPDYVRKSDVPWLKRFASAGGRVVITGDVDMRYKPHELQALIDLGLVVISFEKRWSTWNFYQKSALLLFHWPNILERAEKARPATFWCVPTRMERKDKLTDVTPGKQKLVTTKQRSAATKRARAKASASDERQYEMKLEKEPTRPD